MEDFVRWHSPRDWIEEEIISSEGFKIEGMHLIVIMMGFLFQGLEKRDIVAFSQ